MSVFGFLYPTLAQALRLLALRVTNEPWKVIKTMRLNVHDAIDIATRAINLIEKLKAQNAELKVAVAPLAAENEVLKAQLATWEDEDFELDSALSELATRLNPDAEAAKPEPVVGVNPEPAVDPVDVAETAPAGAGAPPLVLEGQTPEELEAEREAAARKAEQTDADAGTDDL